MKINSARLVFGTANLCTKYGNKASYINETKSRELLNFAYKKKIKILDISTDYECFKALVRQYNFKNWKVSFKISKKNIKSIKTSIDAKNFIKNLLKSLDKNKIEYFLFHNSKDMLSKKGRIVFNVLRKFKKANKIGKIGVSVYSNYEIIKIIKRYKINIIQAPFNILDQRLNNVEILKILNTKKIEVHARSIFLQGILIDKKLISKKLSRFNEIHVWYNFLKKNNLNSISEILNFIDQHKFISKIIFGVRSIKQLKQILNTIIKDKIKNYSSFKIKKTQLIDPRKW